MRQPFWLSRGADIDMLVTSGNAVMGAPAALIAALPNLKAICSNGVGYDSIDTEAARSRGIVVTNTPEVLNDCVADLGMALLLDVARPHQRGRSLHTRRSLDAGPLSAEQQNRWQGCAVSSGWAISVRR
ncbi:Glyoxylate/hydroxypyruvate reductase B [Pantoea agglomerans]|uniref:Glyoxylate/hydroxypyruvate reductase B n=1 Tax=Enterobacter agglomerans TaxID=549 RepID=A0A379A9B0_ENTAG|nr:Glyoxylate/hydroxypyruvate reductase B [Pantoea agglomerans]